ncbi:MAG: sensor domain-containing phosphodiesterase [Acidimicrobiales bacterium]
MSVVATSSELDQILGDRAIRSVYQPLVELDTATVIGFEALARGPEGSTLERPDLLFAEARRTGRLVDLDLACRAAALRGALEGGLSPHLNLFVNMEPDAAHAPPSEELLELVRTASTELRVVVEVTERSLVANPAELLKVLAEVRQLGWGVALDDVGADIASLALMPLLRPDVIKLDLRLVQQQPDREIAAIVGAVSAHAERTGALVLAEGLETADHVDTARALGATLGQGWHFARPAPLPSTMPEISSFPCQLGLPIIGRPLPEPPSSTVDAAQGDGPLRRSTKPLLLEMSWHLERQALEMGEHAVILGAFQTADRFTPATHGRYADLAGRAAFVGALGVGIDRDPAPGVRGGDLADDDPLVDEWAVAVIGPHFAAALAARDLHDDGPDHERRFDYVITYDRDRARAVAGSMMQRIVAQAG